MSEKKVILLIVEGPSDEAALGTIMEEYFNSEYIKFLVVHGDITVKDSVTNKFVTMTDIISVIDKQVQLKLEELKSQYGYNKEDYIKIIHIVDMDGACISDDKVLVKENEENHRCDYSRPYYAASGYSCVCPITTHRVFGCAKCHNKRTVRGLGSHQGQ